MVNAIVLSMTFSIQDADIMSMKKKNSVNEPSF